MRTTAIIALAGVASATTNADAQTAVKTLTEWKTFVTKGTTDATDAATKLTAATAAHTTDCPVAPKDAVKKVETADAKADKLAKCTDAVTALATATKADATAKANVKSNAAYDKFTHPDKW